MNTDEGQMHAARIMRESADKMSYAADRIEQAAQRIALLLEDGFGGNGVRLMEALEKADAAKQV